MSFRSQKHSIAFSEDLETILTVPPDGGWGWIIVIASFFCNFVADGTMLSFGVILDELSKYFEVHPTKIAIANSLITGFYCILGPIACALINRFGFKTSGIIGGVIASLSLLCCSFISNLYIFYIIYGFFGGFGLCIVYSTSLIVVNFYFEKWRALAVSIAVCGTGSGIIIYPILLSTIKHFYWRQKFQILSLMCSCICIISALLYKPIKAEILSSDKKNLLSKSNLQKTSTNPDSSFKCKSSFFTKFHNTIYPTTSIISSTSSYYISSVHDDSSVQYSESIEIRLSKIEEYKDYCNKCCCIRIKNIMKYCSCNYKNTKSKKGRVYYDNDINENNEDDRKKCCKIFCKNKSSYISRPMYRDDILFNGSLYTLKEYQSAVTSSATVDRKKSTIEYHKSVTRTTILKDLEEESICPCCSVAVKRTLATMIDLSLFKSLSFVFFNLSGFFAFIGYYIPFVYVIARANEKNMDPNLVNYLLSCIGLFNLLGRLLCGIVSSIPNVNCLIISCVTIILSGLTCLISVYLNDTYGQFGFSILYGFLIAGLVALKTPLLVEMYGLENLTNTFGLCLIIQGFGCLLSTPIAVAVYKKSKTYDMLFIVCGSLLILSALLLMPIKLIKNWEKKT